MANINGTDGFDRLTGTAGDDLITGLERDDTLSGGSGDDTLIGGGGDDFLFGDAGNDVLTGGAGNDRFVMERHAPKAGEVRSADTIADFTKGEDRIDVSALGISSMSTLSDLMLQGNGQTTIRVKFGGLENVTYGDPGDFHGGHLNELIVGVDKSQLTSADFIFATDTAARNLTGTDWNDDLIGGLGNDTLDGRGGGADRLFGDGGNDTLIGGRGNDTLIGGTGNDVFVVGARNDQFSATNSVEINTIQDFTQGQDRIDLSGLGIASLSTVFEMLFLGPIVFSGSYYRISNLRIMYGNVERDVYFGVKYDDARTLLTNADFIFSTNSAAQSLTGTNGRDDLFGALGNDTLSGGGNEDRLYGDAGDDSLWGGDGNDTLVGGTGHDRVYGERGNNSLSGGSGNDTLIGGDAFDTMYGGDGDDSLDGGDGNDYLYGDAGNDRLVGGSGQDIAYISGASANYSIVYEDGQVRVTDLTGKDGIDILIGVEKLTFSDLTVDLAPIYGTSGDDLLKGTISHDYILGGDGNDTLMGEAGTDTLVGGAGNDTLIGDWRPNDFRNDTLIGGDGVDTAVFYGSRASYTITTVNGQTSVTFLQIATDLLTGIERLVFDDATVILEEPSPLPVLSLTGGVMREGQAGTAALIFTASLSAASSRDVSFTVTPDGGTATPGHDFVFGSQTVTIAAGSRTATISVPVTGDTRVEGHEKVILHLGQVSGATLAGGSASIEATGTILNDDFHPAFTLAAYRALNPDLTPVFGTDLVAYAGHYVTNGQYEGRPVTGFDAEAYAALNPDLFNAFGLDEKLLANHYLNNGRYEGRAAEGFDAVAYAVLNPDLFSAFGSNHQALVAHYISNGRAEGRLAAGFDAEAYAALNPDLFRAFGLNAGQLMDHYMKYGRAEGRQAIGFDAETYAVLNPDLLKVFGLDHAALVSHYISNGRAEGRLAFIADPVAITSPLDLL
ncbi:MAG: M10 family metallopeptidase C-terminal domain-containing protein [Niveispirillum sp.]|nr:M10 family metallopeptidase C-terminal domain-containing protein [Niveispirillum sp.]